MKKGSLILYTQQYEAIKHLPVEDKGVLLDAIFHYHITGNIQPDLPPMVSMAFSFIRTQLDRDMKKYEKICERNRINGSEGGRPKNPSEPKKPTGLSGNPKNPSEPKKADNDNDNENDNEIDNEIDIDLKKRLKQKEILFKKTIEPYVSIYGKNMCNEFYLYWTEPNKSKAKLRFEMEKTWDVSRRLRKWADNEKNFKKNGQEEKSNIYDV